MKRLSRRITSTRVTWSIGLLFGVVSLLVASCAGTPKVSQWTASNNLTYDQVYAAALRAGTENGFTVVNADKTAGVISMRKQEYGGKTPAERRMSVYLKQVEGRVVVSSKIVGSDFGIIEGALGGAVHKGLTRNFYVYLFRELNITDPSDRNVVIEDPK